MNEIFSFDLNNNNDKYRYKVILAEDLVNLLDPIRLKIEDYLKNRDYIESVLRDGREWALESADKTMRDVRHRIGIDII